MINGNFMETLRGILLLWDLKGSSAQGSTSRMEIHSDPGCIWVDKAGKQFGCCQHRRIQAIQGKTLIWPEAGYMKIMKLVEMCPENESACLSQKCCGYASPTRSDNMVDSFAGKGHHLSVSDPLGWWHIHSCSNCQPWNKPWNKQL